MTHKKVFCYGKTTLHRSCLPAIYFEIFGNGVFDRNLFSLPFDADSAAFWQKDLPPAYSGRLYADWFFANRTGCFWHRFLFRWLYNGLSYFYGRLLRQPISYGDTLFARIWLGWCGPYMMGLWPRWDFVWDHRASILVFAATFAKSLPANWLHSPRIIIFFSLGTGSFIDRIIVLSRRVTCSAIAPSSALVSGRCPSGTMYFRGSCSHARYLMLARYERTAFCELPRSVGNSYPKRIRK